MLLSPLAVCALPAFSVVWYGNLFLCFANGYNTAYTEWHTNARETQVKNKSYVPPVPWDTGTE